jgi:hypothetical protein
MQHGDSTPRQSLPAALLAMESKMETRRIPKGTFTSLKSRTAKFVPTEKLGHLSPVREAYCAGGNWIFLCDCGSRVTRVARDVRKRVLRGGSPRCSQGCTGRPAVEA